MEKFRIDLTGSILRVLTYFDIFQYPLTENEISLFLGQTSSAKELSQGLQFLHDHQQIYLFENFYCLRPDPSLAQKRLKDNCRAERLLSKAVRISRFLYRFPFVRGIGISGSLSKNVADENADIDYFIITASNRLWISRTLLHLFKKCTFITGHQHYYCMNYFIDEDALTIPEQNFFTAMELVTLIPVCGTPVLNKFYSANGWTRWFFPNLNPKERLTNGNWNLYLKKISEKICNYFFIDKLDDYFLKVTKTRWDQKEIEGRRNGNGSRMGIRCGKHFAKPNPVYLQQQILQLYKTRLQIMGLEEAVEVSTLQERNNIIITHRSPGNF